MTARRLSAILTSLTLIAIVALGLFTFIAPQKTRSALAPTTVPHQSAPTTTAPAQQPSATTAATSPPRAGMTTETPSITQSPAVATQAVTSTNSTAASGSTTTGVEAQATAGPNDVVDLGTLDKNLPPHRDQVELAYEYGRTDSLQHVARTTPLPVQVGQKETFWVSDLNNNKNYQVSARLAVVLDHVLMYVDDTLTVDQNGLERAAHQFNDQIYPKDRQLFGEEWSPGVDGDVRLTILNTRLSASANGYFYGNDEVPRSVNRYSNEREMFYMSVDKLAPGTAQYGDVLAHEFQHMIEWHQSSQPIAWMNEGLSQLAEDLNGFGGSGFAPGYLANPNLQLTAWSADLSTSYPHYGASYLFLRYFYEKYGQGLNLKELIRNGAGARLGLFAEQAGRAHPDIHSFDQLYGDWATANLLNDPQVGDGRYAYSKLPFTVTPKEIPSGGMRGTVAQFGTDYVDIPAQSRPQTIQWEGSADARLFGADPQGTAWWSNRGDSIDSVLSHTVDLRNVTRATLKFRLWYDIEKDFDYGFVSVSTDGRHWETLRGKYTTTTDPEGVNYGNGYTGKSGVPQGAGKQNDTPPAQWVQEQMDLSPYVGKVVSVRFSMVTDDVYNAPGMVIDDIQVPEINLSDAVETPASGWSTNGWVRTNNHVPQHWDVRLVHQQIGNTTVERLNPDSQGRLQATVAPGEHGVLVISPTTAHTTESAKYTLSVSAK